MKCSLFLIVAFLLVGEKNFAQNPDAWINTLQGEWVEVSIQGEGGVRFPFYGEEIVFIFKNDHFTLKRYGETFGNGSFDITADTLVFNFEDGEIITYPYTLKENTLSIEENGQIITFRKR